MAAEEAAGVEAEAEVEDEGEGDGGSRSGENMISLIFFRRLSVLSELNSGDHGTMVGFTEALVGIVGGCCGCGCGCWILVFFWLAAPVVVVWAGCSEAEVE